MTLEGGSGDSREAAITGTGHGVVNMKAVVYGGREWIKPLNHVYGLVQLVKFRAIFQRKHHYTPGLGQNPLGADSCGLCRTNPGKDAAGSDGCSLNMA